MPARRRVRVCSGCGAVWDQDDDGGHNLLTGRCEGMTAEDARIATAVND